MTIDDNENLPKANKTKHPSKRKRKVQNIKTQVQAKKKKTTNKGELQGEHEQIKYLNPLSQGAYQK
jgi:hypothetical protein